MLWVRIGFHIAISIDQFSRKGREKAAPAALEFRGGAVHRSVVDAG